MFSMCLAIQIAVVKGIKCYVCSDYADNCITTSYMVGCNYCSKQVGSALLQSTEGEDISRLLDSEDDLNAITIENPAVDQFKSSVVNKDCKITNIAIDQCVSQSSGGSSLTYCTCISDYCNNAVLIKASLIASLLFFLALY